MSEPLVHLIDDDEAVRTALSFVLEMNDLPARTYPSAEAFLSIADGLQGGCVVTDVRMPGMTGLELVRHMKAHGLNLPVVVITGHGDVPLAVEAMRAGVIDFLEKPFDDEALIAAIRAAIRHRNLASTASAEAQDIRGRIDSLTPRERQVLDGLVAGQSNKSIGRDLAISPRTVEIYRANVMTKMQASSVSELVRLAMRIGIA